MEESNMLTKNKKIFDYVYTGLGIICLPFNLVNSPNVIHDGINKLEAYRIVNFPKEVKEFGDTLAGNPDKAIEELKGITQDNNDLSNNILKDLSETKFEIENIKTIQTNQNQYSSPKEPNPQDIVNVTVINVCTGEKQQVKMTYAEYLSYIQH